MCRLSILVSLENLKEFRVAIKSVEKFSCRERIRNERVRFYLVEHRDILKCLP